MQAPGKPGPKILFEVSQVESSVRCRIYVTASSQGWARHPHTPLPESDSGKITIQGWAGEREAQRCLAVGLHSVQRQPAGSPFVVCFCIAGFNPPCSEPPLVISYGYASAGNSPSPPARSTRAAFPASRCVLLRNA